jgi:hypothetical protein
MPRKLKEPYDAAVANRVLNLRRAGVPFDVIAEQQNLTPEAARAYFDKALAATDPEFLRALENDRLDRLHVAVWPAAAKGDVNAVDRALRISERRERLSQPAKVNDHAFRDAFDKSAATSASLNVNLDAALVEAGRKIADQVDEAAANGRAWRSPRPSTSCRTCSTSCARCWRLRPARQSAADKRRPVRRRASSPSCGPSTSTTG